MTAYRFSAAGYALLKGFEKLRLAAYDDRTGLPVLAGKRWQGKLTIGYGHTGPEAFPGAVITETEAEAILISDLAPDVKGVAALITVEITQNQFSALVDLAFNIGLHAFSGSSALHLANFGQLADVPAHIMLWDKETVDGELVVEHGLVRRRHAECLLWGLPDDAAIPDFQALTATMEV